MLKCIYIYIYIYIYQDVFIISLSHLKKNGTAEHLCWREAQPLSQKLDKLIPIFLVIQDQETYFHNKNV